MVFGHLGPRGAAVVGLFLMLMVGTMVVIGCEVVTPSPTGAGHITVTATPGSEFTVTPTLVPTSTPSPSPVPTATFTPGQEEGFAPEVRVLAALDTYPWFPERTFDWSPDGQAIVFVSPEGTLWIARAPAFTPQRLAEQRGGGPVWSPDGDQIAFLASCEPERHCATIWVVQADGSVLRDLLPGEKAIRSMTSGKSLGPWLDDRTLVFMDHFGTGIWSLVTIDVATGEVEGVCSAQSKVSPPAFGAAYHWAPSLEAVVVTGYSGGPQMGLLQLLDQTSCRDIRFPRPSEFHAWAPSGDYLLFSHWEWELGQGAPEPVTGQVPTLYIWDVTQDRIKWTGPEGGYEGALSPDGEHYLAFFLLGNPRYEGQRIIGSDLVPGTPFPLFLVVLDIRTEEVLALVPLGEITEFDVPLGIWTWFDQRRPVWSPDGQQLVYWGEGDDLWVMRWDGSNQQRLTEGLDIIYAVWSPDGGRLAIATSDERLFIIERP